jgi:integrase
MGVKVREKIKNSGEWWLYIAHRGKRKAIKVGSKVAANSAAKEWQKKLAVSALPEKTNVPTVAERWTHFDQTYLSSAVSLAKAAGYRKNFNAHILPAFGSLRMDAITDEQMESFISSLVARGLAKSTIGTILREFGRLYTHARKIVGNFNPAVGRSKLYSQAKQAEEIHPLDRSQSQLFLCAAYEFAREYFVLFLTALHSGLRAGELAGLRWEDVDWNNRSLTVRRSIDRVHRKEVPTKSKKVRHVKVSDELLDALRLHRGTQVEYWLKQGRNTLPEWVFANTEGNWCDMSNIRERAFGRCLKQAGLAHRRFHDLRHSYASIMLKDGANPAFIQKQLGHATVEITLRVYSHYLPDDETERRFVNALPINRPALQSQPATQVQPAAEQALIHAAGI